MKVKIQVDGGEIVEVENVRVFVELDDGYQLHTNFTHEGIIHDVLDSIGAVAATDSAEYDDVVRAIVDQDFS